MSKPRTLAAGALRHLRVLAVAASGSAAAAFGQGALAANSPFMPSGAGAAAGAAGGEAYELAGSSVQGSDVAVCIYERQAKHSQWIPVGGIVDGIHVISYDAASDKALVTIAGSFKELAMRKATVAPLSPSSAARVAASVPENAAPAAPVASAQPASPATVLHDQQEARMLVSDLLEIGVQQRKAYQEAKQKAAQEATAQPAK
ncbi:MAG: hypothetical protein ABSH26_02340 [Opitutaceae bacterium]|jgi:hypothetical protein